MKTLSKADVDVKIFPPGHFFVQQKGKEAELVRFYKPDWWFDNKCFREEETDLKVLKQKFEKAIVKRLMSDVK
jgi:asparagine synthetase B (glutamine-hydrolysing)